MHADKAPLADLVIHAAGSPCPGLCGWNRIKGTKQVEESYRLYHQLEVVNLALEKAFPHATVKPLNENVASMAKESDGYISADQGILPLRVCPSSYSRQRRPRYYWAHWKVFRRRKVQVVTGERYIKVVLRPDTPVPDSKWISKGWKVVRTARQFPTLTRPCPVKRPRFGTPGSTEPPPLRSVSGPRTYIADLRCTMRDATRLSARASSAIGTTKSTSVSTSTLPGTPSRA